MRSRGGAAIFFLLVAGQSAQAAPARIPPPSSLVARRTVAPAHVDPHEGSGPLHRATLLREIDAGSRKLFGHDPRFTKPSSPENTFLLVRDFYASAAHEHVLGIYTPKGKAQPAHIRDVPVEEARDLGRMLRNLLSADRASEEAPKGGFPGWRLFVNLSPGVPRLHVHAVPTVEPSERIADWNAFAKKQGYALESSGAGYKVWKWRGEGRGPNGWDVLAVGDAALGTPASLASLPEAKSEHVDRVLGRVWIEAARNGHGSQVETARTDSQIVARSR